MAELQVDSRFRGNDMEHASSPKSFIGDQSSVDSRFRGNDKVICGNDRMNVSSSNAFIEDQPDPHFRGDDNFFK